jgi:hypothetical protein
VRDHRSWIFLGCVACTGNNLPGPGNCMAPSTTVQPTIDSIRLASGVLSFDDLRYAPDLGKVVAVPEGSGTLYLIDPDTGAFTTIAVPAGTASADGKGSTVYGADRANRQIVIVDTVAGQVSGKAALDAYPDYVRASPTTDEVWVSLPGAGRIDTFAISGSPITLSPAGSVSIGDPEGLFFDGAGHAYTNDSGRVVQIDVATHAAVASWNDGCGASHGFPQADVALGLAFGGCETNGGASVVSTATGAKLAGIEAGGGAAILAYDQTLHHLYLRGDGGSTLDLVGVCAGGSLATLASLTIPSRGHGATADQRGHAWICDPENGGILRVTDPFPASAP